MKAELCIWSFYLLVDGSLNPYGTFLTTEFLTVRVDDRHLESTAVPLFIYVPPAALLRFYNHWYFLIGFDNIPYTSCFCAFVVQVCILVVLFFIALANGL